MTPAPALAALAAVTLSLGALPARAADADEQAVRAAAQSLFDSWREGDAAKGERVLHPAFRLTTWRAVYDGDDPARKGEAPHVGQSDRAAMMAIYTPHRQDQPPGRTSDASTAIARRRCADPALLRHRSARRRRRVQLSARLPQLVDQRHRENRIAPVRKPRRVAARAGADIEHARRRLRQQVSDRRSYATTSRSVTTVFQRGGHHS